MKAGRGYVIRFFSEFSDKSLFYCERNDSWYLSELMSCAKVYKNHEEASKRIVKLKKLVKKKYGKGYFYVSKVFYNVHTWNVSNREPVEHINIVKLTKPDKHDFLDSI